MRSNKFFTSGKAETSPTLFVQSFFAAVVCSSIGIETTLRIQEEYSIAIAGILPEKLVN